jgi:hypothetical protein
VIFLPHFLITRTRLAFADAAGRVSTLLHFSPPIIPIVPVPAPGVADCPVALSTPQLSTMSGILLVTTAIFLPLSFLLGMVTPTIVRISLSS